MQSSFLPYPFCPSLLCDDPPACGNDNFSSTIVQRLNAGGTRLFSSSGALSVGFLAGLAKQDMFSYLEILGAGGDEVPNDDLAKTFLCQPGVQGCYLLNLTRRLILPEWRLC
jgi:hypothetical protein